MIENVIQILIVFSVILFSLRKKKEIGETLSLSRNYTNVLRAFAIILVVMHHVSNSCGYNYLTPLGGIGVSVFLLVSGYGLNESYKKKGFSSFWGNKMVRVVLPCWIVVTTANVIRVEDFEALKFIKALLCIDVNWYVRYLFYWYAIFYFVTKYFAKQRLLIFAIISFIMLFFLQEIEAEQSFSFLVGVLISNSKDKENQWLNYVDKYKYIFFIIAILAFVLKQNAFIRSLYGTIYYNVLQLFIKLFIGLFIVVFLHRLYRKYQSTVIDYLGKISYELYLTHCAFLFLLHSFNNVFLSMLLFYAVSVFTAIILYNIDSLISKKYKKLCQNS